MTAHAPIDPRIAMAPAAPGNGPEVTELAPRDELVSYEPATGAELWRGAITDPAEAIARARGALPAWAAQSTGTRIEMVRRFANVLRKESETLMLLLARETGKPAWEARDEIATAIARFELAIRAHSERAGQRRLTAGLGGDLVIRHRPHGVMAVITPFSQPVLVAIDHIVPALISGNTVVFKPSEKAPACGAMLVECAHTAGIPPEAIQGVIGGPDIGHQLVIGREIDALAFSGSVPVGQRIARIAAQRPGRLLALEMGGNNPLVVWDTPLIAEAAVLVVQSAFTGAGQRCTSTRRLIVSEKIAAPLIEAVKKLVDRIITGAPFDEPVPFMGPVIDEDAADGLTQSLIWLMSHGGRTIRHMLHPREGLPFVSPAMIDVTAMTERPDVELFGPLLQVIRVEDFDAAIAAANATRYGLVAGLVGGAPKDYEHFRTHVRAGIIAWNRPTITDVASAPVGGVGLSGNHRPGGAYATDYCGYPVTSVEVEQPRATLGTGFAAEV